MNEITNNNLTRSTVDCKIGYLLVSRHTTVSRVRQLRNIFYVPTQEEFTLLTLRADGVSVSTADWI